MQFIDLSAQQERIRGALDAAIAGVLDHGRYIMGPEVAQLESDLGQFCGAPSVIGCASGTDALVMALMARHVGPGQAVFVPTFTFAATAEAVAILGATPVFVDVDESTYNLDVSKLAEAIDGISPDLRPVGVIGVDMFGLPADYPAIANVIEPHRMWMIADAAQSFGATAHGVRVGEMAQITTTSFFPAKPLGCYGDGGAVMALDAEDATVVRSVRVHGSGTEKYDNVRLGINGRLDTIQAAILIEKLKLFPTELQQRQAVADRYSSALADIVEVPVIPAGFSSSWAQYTIQVDDRDKLIEHLRNNDVPTAVYYPRPLHLQTAYRDYPIASGGLGVSERLSGRVLSLPMHPYLSESDQTRIVEALASR
ncbi:MAG: DegT/DnrJ/EryC1/StrS aminotransferase family protein [Microthrixaceae bacterium]